MCRSLFYASGCWLSQELRAQAAIEAIVRERNEYTAASLAQVRAALQAEQDKLQEYIACDCLLTAVSPCSQVLL